MIDVYAEPYSDLDPKALPNPSGRADSAAKAYRIIVRALKEAGDPDPGIERGDVRYFAGINAYAIYD